jgi:hypothetical protein
MNFSFEEIDYYNKYSIKCNKYKSSISKFEDDWTNIQRVDLNIGNYIYVEYTPSSQKYLYTHTPECGKIVEIDEVTEDIYIINQDNEKISIIKDGLGLYSSAYDMYIQKYVKPKRIKLFH